MVELVSELIYRIDMGGYCLDEGGDRAAIYLLSERRGASPLIRTSLAFCSRFACCDVL